MVSDVKTLVMSLRHIVTTGWQSRIDYCTIVEQCAGVIRSEYPSVGRVTGTSAQNQPSVKLPTRYRV